MPVVTEFQTVCCAYIQKDLLRAVSVVVEYKCACHENCPEGMVLEQMGRMCSDHGIVQTCTESE